jgi:hypothetical protein
LATIFAQIGANGKDISGQLLAAAGPFIITDYRRFGYWTFSLLPTVFAFE